MEELSDKTIRALCLCKAVEVLDPNRYKFTATPEVTRVFLDTAKKFYDFITTGEPTDPAPVPKKPDTCIPLSALLTARGKSIKASVFTKNMMAAELMKEITYVPERGRSRNYKVLTPEASEFGKNVAISNDGRLTQPRYYANKFDELLIKLGLL